MRDRIRDAIQKLQSYPDHAGLAYEVWAHLDDGKADDRWLNEVTAIPAPQGYRYAVDRWKDLRDRRRDCHFHMRTQGRLLVGHGNLALTEVGITLHHTWGVPVIPGSALKGLLAHHVAACHGAVTIDEEDAQRWPYAGNHVVEELVKLEAVTALPNTMYRRLFGAPELTDRGGRVHPACRGQLVVHDALWVPDDGEPFLCRDVLTVHHRGYYQGGASWPSDHENPNPVPFVSVRPGARFLFTLSCDDTELLESAATFLIDALQEWGVGGKTAAGYGRLRKDGKLHLPAPPEPPDLAAFRKWLDTTGQELSAKQRAKAVEGEWISRLRALDERSRSLAAIIIKRAMNPKQYRPLLQQLDQER
jgi:CRISPR-associated protein Cmr6